VCFTAGGCDSIWIIAKNISFHRRPPKACLPSCRNWGEKNLPDMYRCQAAHAVSTYYGIAAPDIADKKHNGGKAIEAQTPFDRLGANGDMISHGNSFYGFRPFSPD